MKKIFTFCIVLFTMAAAQAQMRYLKGTLQGSQEVPANASAATGVVIVRYNTATKMLLLSGNYKDLTAAASVSHIHSPAAPGNTAPVIIPLANTGGTTGTISGSAVLSSVQENDLLNGMMYVNVHDANYPDGEIRAQLSATTDGQTDYYNGRLQGAQQVPPNGSTGFGSVEVLLDKTKDSVFLTGSFSGLTAAASAAHIHNAGAPGVNGPVFQNLIFSTATSGTLSVAAAISVANLNDMVAGNTYVNIHNTPFPNGEIRAQLTKLSQYRFLKGTMQGSQEVPANSSAGKGTVIVKYNMETKLLELVGDYQNISSAISMSHIHSPAAPGTNGPVIIPLANTGGTSGTLTGSATLTAAQESDLLNGFMYANVHDANFPDGEMRAQLTVNAGESQYLTGNLQGAQQNPAVTTNAAGTVTALLDRLAGKVYLTGSFSGLTTPASAGHIHEGITGVNGPIIVPLSVTAATAGTITGSGTVSAGFADSMIRGFTYANIHNATYPGGEIRAQLGDLILPLKLIYFNGYKSGNNISLIWETSQEINLRQFEIEQQDATTGLWMKKGTTMATGGNNTNRYTYTDVPAAGKNEYVLYRLKMVDADGKFTYSPVVRINYLQSKAGLTIMANPVTNSTLAFTISGLATEQKAPVMIADYNGRIILRTTASTLQNNRLDVSRLAAGIYKLIITVNGVMLQESFSKQ